MQKQTSVAAMIGAFAIAVAMFIAMVTLQGFIFAQLWEWYLVPLGLPLIGYVQAFMILVMARLATFKVPLSEETDSLKKTDSLKRTGQIVTMWLFAWGVGYMLSSYAS